MRDTNYAMALDELVYAGLPPAIRGEARERLRALLVTQLALRSTIALRRFLVHVLAALGGLLAVTLVAPEPLAIGLRHALAWTWWACGCTAAASAVAEHGLRADAGRLLGSKRRW
jgi:hypothetical protein